MSCGDSLTETIYRVVRVASAVPATTGAKGRAWEGEQWIQKQNLGGGVVMAVADVVGSCRRATTHPGCPRLAPPTAWPAWVPGALAGGNAARPQTAWSGRWQGGGRVLLVVTSLADALLAAVLLAEALLAETSMVAMLLAGGRRCCWRRAVGRWRRRLHGGTAAVVRRRRQR